MRVCGQNANRSVPGRRHNASAVRAKSRRVNIRAMTAEHRYRLARLHIPNTSGFVVCSSCSEDVIFREGIFLHVSASSSASALLIDRSPDHRKRSYRSFWLLPRPKPKSVRRMNKENEKKWQGLLHIGKFFNTLLIQKNQSRANS